MAHGAGGKASRRLVEGLFAPLLIGRASAAPLGRRRASSRSAARASRITTDSFVVTPLRFPGGSIGELAVNGTVNDLAVSGARADGAGRRPSCSKPGCRRRCSRPKCARWPTRRGAPGVAIVGGDTKVVEHGKADGMYITTTGIGRVAAGRDASTPGRCGPAIEILLSGPDRRSRHHDPARARRARSRGRPPLRHALGAAAGRGAGRRRRAGRPLDARSDARRRRHRRSTSWRATAGSAFASSRSACRCATRCAAPASCWASIRCTSPTKASSSPSSRRSCADAALDGAARGARRRRGARSIGEVRDAAGAARCSSTTRYGGTPRSSTCWSAIRCRGSAEAERDERTAAIVTQLQPDGADRGRLLGAQPAVRGVLRARGRPAGGRLPRDVGAVPARRPAAGVRPRALRDRRAARLGRVRASGHRRQARAAGARSVDRSSGRWLDAVLRPDDIVMGFGPPEGDAGVSGRAGHRARRAARRDDVRAARASTARTRVDAGHRRSVHPPGADRDPLPHAVGDGARLLRAPRAGA